MIYFNIYKSLSFSCKYSLLRYLNNFPLKLSINLIVKISIFINEVILILNKSNFSLFIKFCDIFICSWNNSFIISSTTLMLFNASVLIFSIRKKFSLLYTLYVALFNFKLLFISIVEFDSASTFMFIGSMKYLVSLLYSKTHEPCSVINIRDMSLFIKCSQIFSFCDIISFILKL